VSVISAETSAVIKTLTAGDEPTAFCFSARDRRIYWVNEWSHTVAVVDAATDTQVQLVPLGPNTVQPVDIAYNSVNGLVYTANRLTLNIGVITVQGAACPADLDGSGSVGGADLAALLAGWGTAAADLSGDAQTNGVDLSILLAAWGPC
jgi:DNA-binding beta-propeller fold protein YncE